MNEPTLESLLDDTLDLFSSEGLPGPTPVEPEANVEAGVPTLAPNRYRAVTPMLRARFLKFGRWKDGPNGTWLDLRDMEQLWRIHQSSDMLTAINHNRLAGQQSWLDEASALFKPERLTLFAGSDLNYFKIYLLWLDVKSEPEVLTYDSNGESRFADLRSYLRAYLAENTASARI